MIIVIVFNYYWQTLTWLLRTVTQTGSVHDVLWNMLAAMVTDDGSNKSDTLDAATGNTDQVCLLCS
jgi:hypothetical protein